MRLCCAKMAVHSRHIVVYVVHCLDPPTARGELGKLLIVKYRNRTLLAFNTAFAKSLWPLVASFTDPDLSMYLISQFFFT